VPSLPLGVARAVANCRPDRRRARVLPAAHRLKSSSDFSAVTRRGSRARAGAVIVYVLPPAAQPDPPSGDEVEPADAPIGSDPVRVGLVVGRSVGGSVVRHRVSRRLRPLIGDRLGSLPDGSRMVVRALPETAAASSNALARDLDRALARLTDRPMSAAVRRPGGAR